jgi:hypothetical protein
VAKIIDSLVSDAVKRFVMNPEYMRAAWMREMENNLLFGMTTDEMLMRGLDRDSHQLPHFAGAHVYPVFPGAAAMCGFPPLLLMHSNSYYHTLFHPRGKVCLQTSCMYMHSKAVKIPPLPGLARSSKPLHATGATLL